MKPLRAQRARRAPCGALLLLLVMLPLSLAGQPRRSEASLYEPVPPFRCEAWGIPSTADAQGRIDVRVWLDPALLVFVRTAAESSATPFAGAAEISIEATDSSHAVVYRKFVRKEFLSATSDASRMHESPAVISGAAHVPPGSYTVVAELTDTESQRRMSRRQTVRVGNGSGGTLQASSLFWCEVPGPGEDTASGGARERTFLGNVLPAGRSATGFLACAGLRFPESARLIMRLYRPSNGRENRTLLRTDTIVSAAAPGAAPAPDTLSGEWYTPLAPASQSLATFAVALQTDTLPVGSYTAEVTVADGERLTSVTQDFMVAWPQMPRSLALLATAVRPLEYLMTKPEYDALKRLNDGAQRQAFERFWREKSPVPGKASNELMMEFYRRVDAASQEFATIRNPDGAMTDRGKVYILFGPPTTRNRILGTNTPPREVWTYASTKKSVIFIDEKRTGDYTLVTEQ